MNPSNGLPGGSPGGPVDRPVRRVARFGTFEFDVDQGRLTRNGREVKIQQQPAMVLACLVRRPNVIVTREELQLAVWPSGTWVEFDYSLNTAINRIRRTLGDTAAQPRFVETVPKRGYRFIAPVEFLLPIAENGPGQGPVLAPMPGEAAAVASPVAVPPAPVPPAVRPRFRWPMMLAAATGVILAGGGFYVASRATAPHPPPGSQVVRSTIVLPQGHRVGALAISPQGDQIVY